MSFDLEIISTLKNLENCPKDDVDYYMELLEAAAKQFTGKENELEDIIYDFGEDEVRMEGMMVCKIMQSMDRLRIFRDLELADQNKEISKWGGILFRQEHANKITLQFHRSNPNKTGDDNSE